MSELILMDEASNESRESVAKLIMEGKTPRAVAMKLGMKIVQVNNYWNEYQTVLKTNASNRDLAEEYLHRMTAHYDRLISESYANLEKLETLGFDEKVSAQFNATLKNISEYERQRVDVLQKAGLLDASDLGDELAEREAREEMILGILRNDLCDDCKVKVRDKITQLTKTVQGTVVD